MHPASGILSARSLSAVLALLASLMGGCGDPGWRYHSAAPGAVPDEEGGENWVQVAAPDGVLVRVTGDAFTGSLTVRVHVKNDGATPLSLRSVGLRVSDRQGRPLDTEDRRKLSCDVPGGSWVTLARGQVCWLEQRVSIDPFWSSLEQITVDIDGLVLSGQPLPLAVALQRSGGAPLRQVERR